MAYKTPGVYVEEISTFPPSVVPVETAIPAFIGHTQKNVDADGNSLRLIPTRIKSLLDFETYFGGAYRPASYVVELNTNNLAVGTIIPRTVAVSEPSPEGRRYYLYNCLRHFYANGGGPCYIVSVGDYRDAPALGDTTTPTGLLGGLSRLERFDEPTLLLFPDGVSLNDSDLGALQVAALAQCEKLQDRFVIMDLRQEDLSVSASIDPITTFRNSVGTNNLKYGAAYYPWLQTIYRPEVHFRHLRFIIEPAKDNTLIPNSTLDTLIGGTNPTEAEAAIDALVPTTRNADTNVQTVISAVNISAMVGADSLTLSRDNFAALSDHFKTLLNKLRQVSIPPAGADATEVAKFEGTVRERFGNLLLLPRAIALAMPALDANTTTPAELKQAIANLRSDNNLRLAIIDLVKLEKNTTVLSLVSTTRTTSDVATAYVALDGKEWIAPNDNINAIPADTSTLTGVNLRATALNAAAAIQKPFDTLSAAIFSLFEVTEFLANEAEKQLFANHPVMKAVMEKVQRTMSVLPTSGGVAGVYAASDRTRGVWKAPANVSLADVVGPVFKINDADQADLNVHTTGKSINAIRAFTGKGTLVWGARTLAGNDNEWRYVPVRRFFNMAEESIKKATEPFVFEPNNANTWVRVRAMIENFLTLQWRAGALTGAKPEQAFYVKVGLGETMTAQDILEGRMIVEIGIAVVRAAEFIILKFAHKMQVS